MGIHAFHTTLDYNSDRKAGNKTFATEFGKRSASLFALIVFVSSLIFCSLLFLIASIYLSEKLASLFFKLVFLGFIVTSIMFFLIKWLVSFGNFLIICLESNGFIILINWIHMNVDDNKLYFDKVKVQHFHLAS